MDAKIIAEMLNTSPLLLLSIKDEKVIQYLNELVPYSTGFEIECNLSDNFNAKNFTDIPDIMDVNIGSSEQRFRIPSGLKGIICLYNIANQLKVNSLLNPLSGIHYHVDCTDCWSEIKGLLNMKVHQEYVLSEMDGWLGEGETYSEGSRYMGSWFKLNDLRTIEYRMGEMTFDYRLLLKRIVHCNAITKKFKVMLGKHSSTFEPVDKQKVLTYSRSIILDWKDNTLDKLRNQLYKLSKPEPEPPPPPPVDSLEQMREAIRQRSRNI